MFGWMIRRYFLRGLLALEFCDLPMLGHCDGVARDHQSADVAGLVFYLHPFEQNDPNVDLVDLHDDRGSRMGRIQHLTL